MLKKRIIFQLLTDGEYFYLSRNFRLSKVGDFDWLLKNLHIEGLFEVVDEVSVINVKQRPMSCITPTMEKLMAHCYVPMSLTGGLDSIQSVEAAMSLGVEKIGFSTALNSNHSLIEYAASKYGRQAVMGHVDYRQNQSGQRFAYSDKGSQLLSDLATYIEGLASLPLGEVCIHSISREGSGMGFDFDFIEGFRDATHLPLTVSGGASKAAHFEEVVGFPWVTGMATANLLSFVKGGMSKCRAALLSAGFPIAKLQTS